MSDLDSIRVQVETLERNWQVRKPGETNWAPFKGQDWNIEGQSAEPLEVLKKVRSEQVSVDDQFEIGSQCRGILSDIWGSRGDEGGTNVKTGQKNGAILSANHPQHFHCYRFDKPKHDRWQTWRGHADFDPARPDVWWCTSVHDAAEKYSWSDSNVGPFEDLALALQHAVRMALQEPSNPSRSALVGAVCLNILTWGGVRSRGKKPVKPFEKWIFENVASGKLSQRLVEATSRLIPQSNAALDCFDGLNYFMDSSSTKIYAALGLDLTYGTANPKQDVLIYDGRVAAALGLITRYTLASVGIASLPEDLSFPVERRRLRNPSSGAYQFPVFKYGSFGRPTHRLRAKFARLASRYIQEVTGESKPSRSFVEAEKGLFMIGYNVISRCDNTWL